MEDRTIRELTEYYFGRENKGEYPAEIGKWHNQVSMDKFIASILARLKKKVGDIRPKHKHSCTGGCPDCTRIEVIDQSLAIIEKELTNGK